METKQFKAESKRLLDLMINSIYTHREIFLRELISNASDAIDKIYYKSLSDDTINFNKDDFFIKVSIDKDNRILKISDTGIGMTKEELDDNLGVIAKSGSLQFKKENEAKEGCDIIGQFGVGFYSSFLIADKVTVITKAFGSNEAYKWESTGVEGYTIEPYTKSTIGTDIILHIKENTEDENFDEYLNEYKIKSLIKKYSDFIRYPIKMDITERKLKEGSESEYEDYLEEKVVNSMVPIWRKNKNELTKEDYENFYKEKHYGFDNPLKHIHLSVDGTISYNAILYIPENMPYDFYTKEYEKGLELYSNGVMIMNRCADLLPDYFSFVKGIVDSEDLSLNISREILQHDRQLRFIAKNIKNKIKNELEKMLRNERENYEKFYKAFGRTLKFGVYDNFGAEKEVLQDLLMFYSSKEKKMVTLDEYITRMTEDQKYIYYAVGESVDRIEKMPQTEVLLDKGFEILYFTDDIDEFAIKMLMKYKEKEFKSVSSSDLGLDNNEDTKVEENNEENKSLFDSMKEILKDKISSVKASKKLKNHPVCLSNEGDLSIEMEKLLNSLPNNQENKSLFDSMKEILNDKISSVKASKKLKNHPVCLSNEGDLSIEMEKLLNSLPNNQEVKAKKVLEINVNHEIFNSLKNAYENDKDKLSLYTNLLYNQALLIEGLSISDPIEFTNNICKLMK